MILPREFYNRSAIQVAQDLLGCFLVVCPADKAATANAAHANEIIICKIVETEAYEGPNDLASHASRGRTGRNEVMFGNPGIIYVYFTYGMHYMLNIVTGPIDYPAAVLIRAISPPASLLSKERGSGLMKFKTDGPAKLTKTLQIDKAFNKLPIYIKKHGLWIEGRDEIMAKSQIGRATRIGVDYAGIYKDKKWRFYLKNSEFLSRK